MPTDHQTGKSNADDVKAHLENINSDLDDYIRDSRKCDPLENMISKILYLKDFESTY
jgi:hypothetical protein